MNKRSSKNSHGKRYLEDVKGKKVYWKTVILIIISMLMVSEAGLYLKYIRNVDVQKVEVNNEISESKKDVIEEETKEEIVAKEPIKKTILLSFAGDFTLGTDTKFGYDGSLPAAFINGGRKYSYFTQNVSSIFNEDDYTLVNLETTFTDSDIKAPKQGEVFYNFKGPKDYVNILTKGSIEGVTIANNHIYDYGKQGVKDTVDVLKANNIDICGEGYKILKDIKGIKFGFLGYTGWEYSKVLKTQVVNDITELRKQGAKIIIPYFHWGIESTYEPYDVQQNLGRFAIDNGADAVIGSHPHVIQSMENYKGKLIAYSMGNFCFGGNSNPPDKRTFILQCKANMEDDKLINFEYKVLPAMVSSRSDRNDYIPTLAKGENKANILKTLNELSPSLKGNIRGEFFDIE